MSHPAWVCGLKLRFILILFFNTVTPCVGVWIETVNRWTGMKITLVTPCVGVWIETWIFMKHKIIDIVTPCVGVWIETLQY